MMAMRMETSGPPSSWFVGGSGCGHLRARCRLHQFSTKLVLVFTPPDAAPTRRAESHAERGTADPQLGPLARALDRLLEATIVGGFSCVGSMAAGRLSPGRSRRGRWSS
jgi:hypothetical protein